MIDKKQIEQVYSGESLEAVKNALETLASLGFWQVQIKSNQHRLVESFESQDENELSRQIREARQENKVYLTLESLYPPQ